MVSSIWGLNNRRSVSDCLEGEGGKHWWKVGGATLRNTGISIVFRFIVSLQMLLIRISLINRHL